MMVLSVPSWVIPGTYGENLAFLRDKTGIGGVELLFYLYDDQTRALFDAEEPVIREYARRFTFTAHLPDRVEPELGELVGRLFPLVRRFIIHPGPPEEAETLGGLLCSWMKTWGRETFLIENTLPGRLEALLPRLPRETGLCMDTGHLLLEGKNPADFFTLHGNRVGEIHLHGVDRESRDGRLPDHRPLRGTEPWLRELLPRLAGFTGVINLELFSWEEVTQSAAALKEVSLTLRVNVRLNVSGDTAAFYRRYHDD
ncbi:MAG: AP endonuclease [Spirochaetaceae bacterium]|jgi:hypothetical protein|nr:AP endonuclease [Spirochaetaceae bacterium]